jgi:hypothetical protein
MENAIIIISQHDIPAAAEAAKTLDDYVVYVFDPLLVDKVQERMLLHARFVIWENCPDYPQLEKWSHAAALSFERELDAAVREIVPEVSICAWQHHNFTCLSAAIRWYTGLWDDVISKIPESRLHVFMCDNPAHYYWPSFVPALLLLQKLKSVGRVFSAYTYGPRHDETDVVPDLRGRSEAGELLVHLPTCLYDYNYINDELQASGKSVINIQAKNWDVSITSATTMGLAKRAELDHALPESFHQKAATFKRLIADKIDALLTPYIATPTYRAQQAQFFAEIYTSQLATYYLLEEYFQVRKPAKVIISDHDAGFHGPIYSFAKHHEIPVLLIPHSKVSHYVEFDYQNVISLSHPLQGDQVSFANGKRVLNFKLAYPEKFSATSVFPAPIRSIGLVLNSLSQEGIFFSKLTPYINGILEINRWCQENNIELKIRCKPGQLIKYILAGAIGFDPDTMENPLYAPLADFARSCDLCLMYDTPTSAALEFLQNSIPILNPIPEDISWIEGTITSPTIVPRANVSSILGTLETFVADPINFFIFRSTQSSNYINSFSRAYPLRHFL